MPRSIITIVLSLSLTRPGVAQGRAPSTGLWFGASLTSGWARVSCSICRGRHDAGWSAYLRLGGAINRSTLVGADFSGWLKDLYGVRQTLTAFGVTVMWYPNPARRLSLSGGVAFVSHRAEDGTDVVTANGLGPRMGIAYDLPAGHRWYITPYFDTVLGVVGGNVKFNGGTVTTHPVVSLARIGFGVLRR